MMEDKKKLKLIVILFCSGAFLVISSVLCFIYLCCRQRGQSEDDEKAAAAAAAAASVELKESVEENKESLVTFNGGEDLTIYDILDAAGEVIGKSNYGTLYKATFARSRGRSVRLLRFLRPACCGRTEELVSVIHILGRIRHNRLVPLQAFYAGPKGEKLLVHPFYAYGTLARFIRDGNEECHKWAVIYRISVGIAQGLDHLHTGLQKPLIHGNLKSKNILLDGNYQPYVSDFGQQLLLNPSAAQEMVESSGAQGYKAPELIKMKDVSQETDIYSFGVILLELLTGREPINEYPSTDHEDLYLPNSMRNAVIGHRIKDLFNPRIDLLSPVTEECFLKLFQLAMACCSPTPTLRPNTKQILRKMEEIGT